MVWATDPSGSSYECKCLTARCRPCSGRKTSSGIRPFASTPWRRKKWNAKRSWARCGRRGRWVVGSTCRDQKNRRREPEWRVCRESGRARRGTERICRRALQGPCRARPAWEWRGTLWSTRLNSGWMLWWRSSERGESKRRRKCQYD